MFIDREIYTSLLDYEYVIFGYYLLDRYPLLFMDILKVIKRLFMTGLFKHRDHLLENYRFYMKYTSLHGMEEVFKIRHEIEGYTNSTPSIVKWVGDTYLVNVRMVNYTIAPDGTYPCSDENGRIRTKNVAYLLDHEFNVLRHHTFSETDSSDRKHIYGVEDVRLITIGGDVYYTASMQNPVDRRVMVSHGRYEMNESCIDVNYIRHPNDHYCEKNWVMFELEKEVMVIYNWFPLQVGKIKNNEFVEEQRVTMPDFFKNFRGSTNGVTINGNLCFITHLVTMINGVRQYYHCFVVMDKEKLQPLDISLPFTFTRDNNIEYCLGLLYDQGNLIISYSLNDSTSNILKVPLSEFKKRVYLN